MSFRDFVRVVTGEMYMWRVPNEALAPMLFDYLGQESFEPDGLPWGARLYVAREEMAVPLAASPPVPEPAKEEPPPRTQRENPRTHVAVRIRDEQGLPLSGVPFDLYFENGEAFSGSLDGKGFAENPSVPKGSFTARLAKYDPHNLKQVGSTPLDTTGPAIRTTPEELKNGTSGRSGQLNQFIIHHPKQAVLRVEGAIFESGSAFPGPAVLRALPPLLRQAEGNPEFKIMCFGHTDSASSGDHKKESDLRAKALHALLASDLEAFHALASDDGWELQQWQQILSALGFAGPVDGNPCAETDQSVESFKRAYNSGRYSEPDAEGAAQRPESELKEDPSLQDDTLAALRGAYIFTYGEKLPAERFFKTPTAGCAEFNTLGMTPEEDRRATLALIDEAAGPTTPPCTEGNAGKCPLVQREGMRCKFYVRWFGDERVLGSGELAEPEQGETLVVVTPYTKLDLDDGFDADFILTGERYTQTLSLSEECKEVDDYWGAHYVEIEFKDVPNKGKYTLKIKPKGEEEQLVLQDVPFSELQDESHLAD